MQFSGREVLLIGRSKECRICPQDNTVSRMHCMLDVTENSVTLRDFGSKNGTTVNDVLAGQRPKGMSAEEGKKLNFSAIRLREGENKIWLGKSVSMTVQVLSEKKAYIPAIPEAGKAPQRGEIIYGYQLVREIGQGGMGTVYLVREKKSKNLYALKIMRANCAVDEGAKQKFLREAFVSCQLNHENVVKIYGAGYANIGFYILMEYCEGESLAKYLKENGEINWRTAVKMTIQMLDSLDYVHNAWVDSKLADGSLKRVKGVVHRDFKPDNVFLTNENGELRLKTADFGLAKAFETAGLTNSTFSGDCAGTVAFMPRQQVLDFLHCKPEVDVWACAATLYYMLAKRAPKPFHQYKIGEEIKAILSAPAEPIEKYVNGLPSELTKALNKALIDNPSIGYQTAAQFRTALNKCL